MPIRLFDSLSRELRELHPAQPDGKFRFYNCGPTVYAPAHIGNFRTFLVNDVIRRLLELEFGSAKVIHVRNLTDVDDKTIKRSREEGRVLAEVTRQWTDKFHADCRALNCLDPHAEPRAADPRYLQAQVDMIDVLLRKGHAYRAPDGSVYFKVASFSGYGALSRVRERELQPGAALKAQTADADEKEDGSDFALWKAWKEDDGPVKWPGPEGAAAGRPGWHIECSAMAKAVLGDTIDLHTGGVDLLFPHHENEIAQSECCNGRPFARHWYHSEHLLVDGKKMSKSLGNLYTLDDLTAKGFSPMAIRYALLAGHPRKQLNFMLESLHAADSAIGQIRDLAKELILQAHHGAYPLTIFNERPEPNSTFGAFESAWNALLEDLNIPLALGELFSVRNKKYSRSQVAPYSPKHGEARADFEGLRKVAFALGIRFSMPSDNQYSIPAEIISLAEKRWAAKQSKDFKAADLLRHELAAAGWTMLDGKNGYTLEPARK